MSVRLRLRFAGSAHTELVAGHETGVPYQKTDGIEQSLPPAAGQLRFRLAAIPLKSEQERLELASNVGGPHGCPTLGSALAASASKPRSSRRASGAVVFLASPAGRNRKCVRRTAPRAS